MRTRHALFLLLSIACCCWQCSDVIIPNISEDFVFLRAPQDSITLNSSTITLNWEALPDAIDYRVEVGSPSFEQLQLLPIDSFTVTQQLTVSLPPGNYAWRVTAFNEAYASACCQEWTFTLEGEDAEDLSFRSITLLLPANGSAVANSDVTFNWEVLTGATSYRFQHSAQSDFSTLILDTLLTSNELTLNNLTEGTYYWRVKGINDNSDTFTNYQSANFTIDNTAPPAPVLNLPVANDTITLSEQAIDFSWQSSQQSFRDSLYWYEDVFLDVLFLQTALQDSTQLNIDGSNIDLPAGVYYWRVRSIDAAGNTSDFSESRKITIE